jgi:REP element-mobilizing transposase RayT
VLWGILIIVEGMRIKRELLLAPGHEEKGGLYHCVSRVVWKEFIFGEEEKEYFRKVMRVYEKYCGVEVQAYCLMSNHFHILVRVPPRETEVMEDEVFLEHLGLVYSEAQVREVRKSIEQVRTSKGEGDVEYLVDEIKQKYTRRMWDLSEFMKVIKQKFTLWYNKRNGKRGTLWEGRFKSLLVQEGFGAKMTAAYIDLNPVRAGMVNDPKDYRWCSYGEAVAGSKQAQQGLLSVMNVFDKGIKLEVDDSLTWKDVMTEYRMILAEEGELVDADAPMQLGESKSQRQKKSKGFSRDKVKQILDAGGSLSWAELLRCRTRYFTDGVAIGSKEFVNGFFENLKSELGGFEKRQTGARKMKRIKGRQLHTMRDLKKQVIKL